MSRPLPPNEALSTTVVSNLVGGVSSRADALREPNQVTEMVNALPNWSEGLKRRPRTTLLFDTANFGTPLADDPTKAFIHTYNRDKAERYAILVVNNDLKIVSLVDGTEKTVAFTNGTGYLVSTDPLNDFRAITVGDKTFLVNSTITPAIKGATTSPAEVHEALVWVRVGDYGTAYNVTLDGTTYGFISSQSHREQIDTNSIAFNLSRIIPAGQNISSILFSGTFAPGDHITLTDTVSGLTNTLIMGVGADPDEPDPTKMTLNGVTRLCTGFFDTGSGTLNGTLANPYYPLLAGDNNLVIVGFFPQNFNFTCTTTSLHGVCSVTNAGTQAATYTAAPIGSTVHIVRQNAADFTCVSADGLGSQAIEVIKGSIQLFEDLPVQAPTGFRVKITGDPLSAQDDYYVTYSGTSWVETLRGGEDIALDPATMPHVLTRNSDGTFTFAEGPYSNRLVGDLTTNPFPSLIGQQIQDVFFYKNRVGYVAGINVVMSEVNTPFNFFRTTVTALLDSDLIDVSLAIEKTAAVAWTTPTALDLLLWTDLGQASIAGDRLLTPKTVEAVPASNYDTSLRVKPVRLGNNMYYAVDRKNTTGLFEYQTVLQNGILVGRHAVDISESVASYIQGLATMLLASDTGKTIVLGTTKDAGTLFICTIIGEGDNQLYSWHKWQLSHSHTFVAADMLNNELIVLIKRGTGGSPPAEDYYYIETLIIEPAAVDTGLPFQIALDAYRTFDGSGVFTA